MSVRGLGTEHGAYQSRQDRVWRLNETIFTVQEDGAEQPDFLHGIRLLRILRDLDSIANIVRVLDEEEDNTGEYFLKRVADQPTQT